MSATTDVIQGTKLNLKNILECKVQAVVKLKKKIKHNLQ
jgi:hypothetical protein